MDRPTAQQLYDLQRSELHNPKLTNSTSKKNQFQNTVISLINKGAAVEFTPEINSIQQPLHLAAFRGHTRIVQKLLEVGANPNALSQENATPIYDALVQGHLEVVKLLVKNGANITGLTLYSSSIGKVVPLLVILLLEYHRHFSTTILYYSHLIPMDEITTTQTILEDLYKKEPYAQNKKALGAINGIYKAEIIRRKKNAAVNELKTIYEMAPPMPGMSMGGPLYQEGLEKWKSNLNGGTRKRHIRKSHTRTRRSYIH